MVTRSSITRGRAAEQPNSGQTELPRAFELEPRGQRNFLYAPRAAEPRAEPLQRGAETPKGRSVEE